MIDPADFFDAVSTYQQSAGDAGSNRMFVLATVHSYVSDRLKLIIDGEADPTAKTFSWVGTAPAVGARVVVMEYANTFLVLGELNNNSFATLNSYVEMLPRGLISRNKMTTASAWVRNQSLLTGAAAISVSANLFANRIYKVSVPSVNIAVNDAAPTRVGAGLRATPQAGAGSGTAKLLQTPQTLANNTARHDSVPIGAAYSPAENQVVKFDLAVCSITAVSGTFPQVRVYADSDMPCEIFVEDMGIYI